ncbi:cell envelope-associated transcriptional attenuator lytR-cpsA-psr, subfamily A1 [Streptomyces laurentii]|uniref:Cell envelope-associated transcriptional attenuator lytR-cpsA-psr, subfamily A1 n=1 Tax=Streptomyces laurentii TaxID=39478 RepID=A0A160NZA1_STRLU|nr:cell envelope-associated transcriptional attenuator lytR-cpsA-psr, subfamily A1 [Streptomyces laurentii]
MDSHSRGGAEGIDPADQWVLNPQTGNYELRLDSSAEQSGPAGPARPRRSAPRGATPPGQRPRPSEQGGDRIPEQLSDRGSERGRGGERRGAERGTGRSAERGTGRSAGRGAGERTREADPAANPTVPGQRRRRAAEPAGGRQAAAARRKRRPGTSRKKKVLLWTGGTMAFVLVGGAAGAYALYNHFNGNINTIEVAGGTTEGFQDGKPFNILLIGTDKRTGKGNAGYGDKNSPGHADTTILFHVSEDRTNATAMSIPRDLVTDIPECESKLPDGSVKTIPGQSAVRFNTSLGQDERDPGCTMRTVKALTGVTVNHFMMADFNAVKEMTTAVGGVKVCLAKPVDDPKSHLKLPQGESTIEGEQALAFVRTRHSFGNESDLDRIKVQQQFLSSMIREMKSSDTLTSPTKLYDLADAATKALTVDSGIGTIGKLKSLAGELAKIDPKNITFTTLPVIDNPAEPRPVTVVPDPTKAPRLFSMLQSDTSLTEVKKKEQDAKNAKAKEQAKLLEGARSTPREVRVDVYNGSGFQGAAQSTINWLQNEHGVTRSTNKSNAPEKAAKTTLTYAPNQAAQARELADLMGLPATALKPGTEDAGALVPMTLVLGSDFKGAGVPLTGPAKAPEGAQTADKQVCAK